MVVHAAEGGRRHVGELWLVPRVLVLGHRWDHGGGSLVGLGPVRLAEGGLVLVGGLVGRPGGHGLRVLDLLLAPVGVLA